MVRLNPSDPSLMMGSNGLDGGGARAEVVDDLLASYGGGGGGTSGIHKRSRPKSSLDYKGPPQTESGYVLPKYPEEAASRAAGGASSAATTSSQRAPGSISEGDLGPMEGLTNEEMYQRMAEAMNKQGAFGSRLKSRPGDPRLEELQKRGFPFAQWAVVLLILGYGFYRLYRLLKPPGTVAGSDRH